MTQGLTKCYKTEKKTGKKNWKRGKKSNVRKTTNAKTLKKDGGIEKEKMHVDKKFAEFSFYIGKIWRHLVQSHI